MFYKNVGLCKFVKHLNTEIFNNCDILDVVINQNTNNPGIKLIGVMIPKGKYQILVRVAFQNMNIFYWNNTTSNKTFLQNGKNIINLEIENDITLTMGLLVHNPIIEKRFSLYEFQIIRTDQIDQMELLKQSNVSTMKTKHKILNDYFDHIYVINLDCRPRKLFQVNRMLQKYQIQYEKFSGIIATNQQFILCKEKNSQLKSHGALGCLLSHIAVLNDAIQKKYKNILILEDDVILIKNFQEKIAILDSVPQWDILYLGSTQYEDTLSKCLQKLTSTSISGFYQAYKSNGTFAYAIQQQLFQVLVDLFSELMMNVDTYLTGIQEKYKCYVIYENLIIADVSESDISHPRDVVKYGKIFGWSHLNYYPLISVVIPVYNGSNFLKECLQSIVTQDLCDYEIIIINDGSCDNLKTHHIIEEFVEINKNIFLQWITHEKNEGLPTTLNDGFRVSHGKYLTWIAHDNKFKPNAFKMMANYLDTHNDTYIVFAGHEIIGDRTGKVYGIQYNQESILTHFQGIVSFMYKRIVKDLIGEYDVELFGVEDLDYWIRILELPPHVNGFIPDVLSEYRKHDQQLSHSLKDKYPELKKIMLQKKENRHQHKSQLFEAINDCQDTIIYPPTVKYFVLFQRPQQILRHLTRWFNCIFITKDETFIDGFQIDKKVIVITWSTFECFKDKIIKNRKILYYTDPRTFKYVDIIKPDITIFDLIDNPVGEFSVWKKNLNDCVITSNIVTYSAIYLRNVLENIQPDRDYQYFPNGCDEDFFKQASKRLNQPMEINEIINKSSNKIIIGYYGYIATWIDFDLIEKIANMGHVHVVMIGLVQSPTLIKKHPNITWIPNVAYEKLINYLSWFDICLIPFRKSEMMLGCNPIKMYEYMASKKPIISTIEFKDVGSSKYYIANLQNIQDIVTRIIQSGIKPVEYRNINRWDDVSKYLYDYLSEHINQELVKKLEKKVAYVTNMLLDWTTFEPRYGGGERYALEIARMLKTHGLNVHFYQMASKTLNAYYYDFPVHCLEMNGLETYHEFHIGYSNMVNDIIKKEKYDYVIYGMPEMCCSKNIFSNSVSINHGVWFDRDNMVKDLKWFDLMKTHIQYPCTNVSVDTNFINYIRIVCPEYVSKLTYIPNFYDSSVYVFTEKHHEKLNIVIPRRANIYRGSRLIEKILLHIPYDVNIYWVGKGDKFDNALLEKLTKRDERFKFIGCSFDEMNKIYAMADIVIIPTIASEGTSLSCIEAMASGCAVISTNIGGLNNLVINMFNGLLVNPTVNEISQAINLLITDAPLRQKLVKNAREMIQEFEIKHWHHRWLQVFYNLGWIIHPDKNEKNYLQYIESTQLKENINTYWKNYVHTFNLHHQIKDKYGVLNHMLSNVKFHELEIYYSPIKICILTRNAVNGGVESIIFEEAKYMNCDVYITNGQVDPKLNPFLYNNVSSVSEVLEVIKNYHLIIYHWVPEFALYAIKMSGIPAIEYIHRRDTDDNDKTLPVTILTHSPFMVNHCFSKFRRNAILLEHPIDIQKFHPRSEIKKEYIGCVCTYNPIKGIDILIDALAIYQKNFGNNLFKQYKIVLYGKDQNNHMSELQKMAQDKNVQCEFYGTIDTYEVINKYKLFIIPSRLEGLPVVLLEALACNVDVIASDIEGVKEFYHIAQSRNYHNLFTMFESENSYDLARKINDWNNTSNQQNNKSLQSEGYIKKYYSTQHHCNKLLNIIHKNIYVNHFTNHVISIPIPLPYTTIFVKSSLTEEIQSFPINNVSFQQFVRLIIREIPQNLTKLEIIVNVKLKNKFQKIPIGYQFDFINDSITYDSDTLVISQSGIMSICSKDITLPHDFKVIQVNIRPNELDISITKIDVFYYGSK